MTRKTLLSTTVAATLALASPSFAGDLVIHPGDAAFGSGPMRLEPDDTFARRAWSGGLPRNVEDKNLEGRAEYRAVGSYTLGNGGAEMRVLPWAGGSGTLRPGAQVAVTW